jgi:AcrR family transcriptional regulator
MCRATCYSLRMTPDIFTSDPTWPYSRAKTAVLSAASAVIREDGPRSATLKNIASRAGITEPAIFRHFDGVDGLFEGLFSVYERVYESSVAAYSAEGQGLVKLRAAAFALVDNIAASRDFAYILVYARHVFRGYPELKAKVAENDSRDQSRILACVSEGIKSGELRSDTDPVSAAISLIGSVYITSVMWIESGFSFDLHDVFADRWDDFERSFAAKPASKSRDAKAASRERAAAFFPLRPQPQGKAKASSAKKGQASKASAKAGKAAKPAKLAASGKGAKSAPKRPAKAAAKAVAKKPSIRGK